MAGKRPQPTGAYLTLDSTKGLVETAQTPQSGALLMTLGKVMKANEGRLGCLLASALSTALGGLCPSVIFY